MEENNLLGNNQNTTSPVQLEKPAQPQENTSSPAQPQENISSPVQLEKPAQLLHPVNDVPPINYAGQPANGAQPGYYGQPGYNGQAMNGGQPGYNGQAMNGGQPGYNGQAMNGGQPGYYGQQPGYNGQAMNGGQPGYNGQAMNGGQPGYYGQQPGYNGQAMNGGQPGYYGQQPGYNGQAMNGGQPGYWNQPNGSLVLPQNPKKKKTGVVIGVIAVIAVILIIALCVIFSKALFNKGNPEEQLRQGLENMTQEMKAYSCAIPEEIGLDELNELDKVHTYFDLSFTAPSSSMDVDNFAIEIDGITDLRNEMAEYDLSVGSYGFSMDIGNITVADNTLYFSMPYILGDEVYSADLTNLGEDFNNSAWADMFDMELPEDYSYTLFELNDALSAQYAAESDADFAQLVDKYDQIMKDAVEYEAFSEKRDFKVGGKTISCGGVRQTIDKDAYNEMLEKLEKDFLESDFYTNLLMEYLESAKPYDSDMDAIKEEVDEFVKSAMSLRFEEDYVLDFYMDDQGRIVNISTPYDIAVSSTELDVDAFAVDISFTGEERALDEIEGGIYVKTGGHIIYLGISRQASVTDELYSEKFCISLEDETHMNDITFEYWNDWSYTDKTFDLWITAEADGVSLELDAVGGFTDITKGKGYTFRIDSAGLNIDGQDVLIMSGTIVYEAADEDIEVPQNATDLFEMSEQEIWSLLYSGMSSWY